MKVLVSGSSGLVGSALVAALRGHGHDVVRLLRRPSGDADTAFWDPGGDRLDPDVLDGYDAVVHLAGESIAAGRWSAERKRRLRANRVGSTRLLAETLLIHERPPAVLVTASAVGVYGDRGDEPLNEGSIPGEGFLADLCSRWEAAAQPARERGLRVVHLRLGVVLAAAGGALARMLTPFRLGLGGRVGSGRQFMSWIHLADVVGAIEHVLATPEIAGAVNVVAPEPVRQADFARALGAALGRPAFLPLPAFAARLLLGEMADELLLASARVEPWRLRDTGYPFRFRELRAALADLLPGERP